MYMCSAFKYHPDANKAPDAGSKFREVQDAYRVLSDPSVRRQYDNASNMASGKRNSINWSSNSASDPNRSTLDALRKNYEKHAASRSVSTAHTHSSPTGSYYGREASPRASVNLNETAKVLYLL